MSVNDDMLAMRVCVAEVKAMNVRAAVPGMGPQACLRGRRETGRTGCEGGARRATVQSDENAVAHQPFGGRCGAEAGFMMNEAGANRGGGRQGLGQGMRARGVRAGSGFGHGFGRGFGFTAAIAAVLATPGAMVAGAAPSRPQAAPIASPTPAPTDAPATPGPLLPGAMATQPPMITAAPFIPPSGPQPLVEPVMAWSVADAARLLDVIQKIGEEGLFPADYQPEALRAAMAAGPGPALDAQASRSFDWLAEDLRDGRTPWSARVQWFAVDPDQDATPTAMLLAEAVGQHDVAGVLAGLDPTYPDYAVLKQALAETDPTDREHRDALRVNMDRWRWLPRDPGRAAPGEDARQAVYLYVNVPEFEVRLMRGARIVRTYRAIVGKPGRTATPQLAEQVKAVVFNPTWTIPQSIIEHDGITAARGRRMGYKVTTSESGTLTMVQPPGDRNSLGRMKIDMPNSHAIYLHDTPNKSLFNATVRAFSHGCIRTERAVELGMTMAMLGANLKVDQAIALADGGKYARVPMVRTFPVYIGYFTVGRGDDGQLLAFPDIYGRDAPVLKSFAAPRVPHTTQRSSDEAVIVAEDPL